MNNLVNDLKYASTHEWARDNGDQTITIGISDFAQQQLGDVVFVELPSLGDEVAAGDGVAVVESVKAASDIFSPVSGTIVAINNSLEDTPELINNDCYEDGWLFKVQVSDSSELAELMDAASYEDTCAED